MIVLKLYFRNSVTSYYAVGSVKVQKSRLPAIREGALKAT